MSSTTVIDAPLATLSVSRFNRDLDNSLEFFITQLWAVRGYDQYHPIGPVERDVCDWIQHGPTHQGELLFRGWGKTYFECAVVAWDLRRDPDWKELIISKSIRQARNSIHLIREWIEVVPFLQHLRPSTRKTTRSRDAARDTLDFFDVGPAKPDARDPSVSAVGIEGQLPGTRAHRVIADDAETDENTQTLEARELLKKKFFELVAIASYGEQRINVVGTYHHEESVYITLAKERGFAFRTWPLLAPGPKDQIMGLAPSVQHRLDDHTLQPGEPVDPDYPGPDRITKLQAQGRTWFAMQCMLVSSLGDTLRYPLRLSDLITFNVQRDQAPAGIVWGQNNGQGMSTRCDHIKSLGFGTDCLYAPIHFDNRWTPYTGTRMWIDPSGAGKDETGYAIVSHASGMLWTKAVGGLAGEPGQSGSSTETMAELAQIARRHNATEVYVEDLFGLGMFAQLLEPVLARHFLEPGQDPDYPNGWKATCENVHVTGQKEVRIIENLEPVLNQHRLVIHQDAAADPKLQHQLTRLTRQRDCLQHDDRVEALAMAVWTWHDLLHQDPDVAAARDQQKLLDEQLEAHRNQLDAARTLIDGQQQLPLNWIQHR